MRWYVEPLAYDQRSFNAAALRLVDDLAGAGRRARRRSWRGIATRSASAGCGSPSCRPQVPFARGGAEIFTDDARRASCARAGTRRRSSRSRSSGTRAPACSPRRSSGACSTSTEADGRPIDIVVATKFPSYVVRHPEKRVWLVHQFRQAYELDRTELGQFGESPEDRALRRQVQELDRVALGEATRLFATSANVAGRLERSTGLVAEVLPHPPQELAVPRRRPTASFVLSVEPARSRQADRPADRGGGARARRSRS